MNLKLYNTMVKDPETGEMVPLAVLGGGKDRVIQKYLEDHPEALTEAVIDDYDILKSQVTALTTAIGEKGETTLFQAENTAGNLWYSGQTITLSESYKNYDYLDFYVHNLGREKIYRFKPDTATFVIRTINLIDITSSQTDTSMHMYETTIKLEEQEPFTTVTCFDANRVGWTGSSSDGSVRVHYTSESDISGALRIFKIVGVTLSANNTELTDVRVGSDGRTYSSAGDAVRGQVDGLHDELDELADVVDNKADVNGVYNGITSGYSEQLATEQHTADNTPYIFRTSGGSADIGNREEDTIIGGTVAWNQLATQGNGTSSKGITVTVNADGSIYLNGTSEDGFIYYIAPTNTHSIQNGHVYLLGNIVSNSSEGGYIYLRDTTNSVNVWRPSLTGLSGTYLVNANTTGIMAYYISAGAGDIINITLYPMLIDLTQMFGSAVADAVYAMEQANAGSGVAWFKAMYPSDFYEYSTGSLESVEGLQSHDMVGFNQWDEEWELGSYNTSSGAKITRSNAIRCKNPIQVLPNTNYYFHCGSHSSVDDGVWLWYDANNNFINQVSGRLNRTQTSPSNAKYLTFYIAPETTYNNDICINLSGTRNGEYESYQKRSYPLDSTLTLRGIPKWNNGLYYDGDTYEADGTVTRRYGVVDLGTLTWAKSGQTYYGTSVALPNVKIPANGGAVANAVCSTYFVTSSNNVSTGTVNGIGIRPNGRIYATDNGASPTGYLVYELATPTTETAEPYQTSQIVDKYGTETYNTTGLVAVGHETKYPTDLKGKLENLPTIPTAPTTNGTYVLKATVTSSGVTYAWVAQS